MITRPSSSSALIASLSDDRPTSNRCASSRSEGSFCPPRRRPFLIRSLNCWTTPSDRRTRRIAVNDSSARLVCWSTGLTICSTFYKILAGHCQALLSTGSEECELMSLGNEHACQTMAAWYIDQSQSFCPYGGDLGMIRFKYATVTSESSNPARSPIE